MGANSEYSWKKPSVKLAPAWGKSYSQVGSYCDLDITVDYEHKQNHQRSLSKACLVHS